MIRENKNIINRKRIYFLFFLFIAAFGYIVYNLISIQYMYASKYIEDAQGQHMQEFIVNSKRGKILDRNGIELAASLQEKTVYANPMLVEYAESEAKALSEILEVDYYDLKSKLEDDSLGFVYIKRQVSSETADLVSQLNLPGIFIQNENKRYYPHGDLAASIIGFTGLDNVGLYGVELEQEKLLRGVDGKYIIEKDVYGKIIPGNKNNYIAPVDGSDIMLTIDSQIQYIAQKNLEDVVKQYEALRAIAVVIDTKTGEIYAMASYPGFDLNNYQDYELSLYKNYAISYTYEPGSTFKIVNISSAIDNGSIGVNQVFTLPPSIKVGDKYIKEIFRTYNIDYTTGEIIKYSSNVGAVTSGLAMGKQLFYDSMIEFGFNQVTGVALPGEEPGFLYSYENWPSSMIGALSIGQSISVTPLQLIRAACVIANGGYLVKPSILKEIRMDNEAIADPEQEENIQIISAETANAVKDMMLSCVEEGTGTKAQLEGVNLCGKTGTAQKANQNGIGYTEKRVITSFLGFGPYEDPRIAVIVLVDEPHGSNNEIWGGTVAAPVFKNIMSFSLKKLRIQQFDDFSDNDLESEETAA
ncbi:MAG: penicillin-binding protein 2 [Actinobacteria bacterium]|nr:penicillin-binding protein 2 [Actinomycetota bacterium]